MIFEKLVMENLRRLRRGRLRVILPDGRVRNVGGLFQGLQAELHIQDPKFWKRCVLFGPIGFAESYMAGEWDSPDLVRLISFFILNSEDNPAMRSPENDKLPTPLDLLGSYNRLLHRARPNSLKNARKNIHEHYDLSNDFFRLWLDETMTYSAGCFDPPTLTLAEAQREKYNRLIQKLQLRSSDHLLEIGCGWGGMSIQAAKTTGCRVTAVTISEEQFREASERVRKEGLEDRVEVLFCDYRFIEGQFDKIVSIEMIEAVGDKYLEEFFAKCDALLKPQGLLALQCITCPDRQFAVLRDGVDFIQKHIFPGSLLLSLRRMNEALFRTGELNLFDWEDFGLHYARTLQIWRENFESVLEKVREQGFSESFIRKWRYYLGYCEAGFGMRHISVAQAVFSRPNNHSLTSPVYRILEEK